MKAIVYTKYGPPEVAQLMDVAKPTPKDNEVLVKVYASTVNRTDAGFRSAEYFVSRFWSGLLRPKFQILGCEFAGIIEAVGATVTTFKPGDKVFGFIDTSFGGHAEYLTIPESNAIAHIPEGTSFEIAAAITEGAHYALVDIRAAKVTAGQQVLVYGATGAIGSAAVQLLKHVGAIVTAVCDTKNVALVKALGADTVIDYKTRDFTKTENKYAFIFDAVGKSSFGQCKPLLTSKGIYISTELGKNGENIWYALTTPLLGGKKLLFPIPSITKEDVLFLKSLVETGAFKPVIDSYYPLEQIVAAYKYVESGQKTGNVVIKIAV
ncbi:NAD(P)-dependent alcohol dehydrogenase [Limnovirga soli]|uniref:Zinc-binding dehydrogenase n=1 Tax=Limnovirga soli TaxID=2656915 RepID=A0A8J8JUP4_9BACT|nr:NAD(P)-dependent alcohol dehydrogenase [Limnovirga soli]NNV57243.1 zinc-binding dehydrogenase [Limnovirga soli]